MKIPFIDLNTQYLSIKSEIDQAIQEVLNQGAFSGGPFVESFEEKFAQAHQAKHCVACGSGTAALHLVLMALETGPGDEVIVPTNTFFATAEAVSLCRAKPIFVDCDPLFYNIDPNKTEKAITKKTKAIIAVHLYGHPAQIDELRAIANGYDIRLIEDCAQAHLTTYKDKLVGNFGIAGCFSFYPSKNLGAYGEGGAIITNDEDIWEKVLALRNHGSKQKYYHEYIGHNYRMDGLQASILNVKLKYLKHWTNKRRQIANTYRKYLLAAKDVIVPEESPVARHVYHLFVVRVPNRENLMAYLASIQISTGIHYPVPCHLQKPYVHDNSKKVNLSVSEQYSQQILSLPIFPELTDEEVQYVSEQFCAFFEA
jgi:dTDP-4-amino-4,6-dideoxygalactose transaminase